MRSVSGWRSGPRAAMLLRLVFRQGLKLTIVGLIIGLAASFALTRITGAIIEAKAS